MLPPWLTPVVIVATTAFIIWQLKPGLLFANTTPTGGDLGGQVFGPAELRDHILPSLTGWSPAWFGGFPAYLFYMPLPALVVLFFNIALPYGVALKLTVAASAILLPVAAWTVGRLSRMPAPIPVCLAVSVLPFLFDDSYFKYGGNIVSAVIGEYAYSLGVPFALVALGLLDVALRTGRWRALAAVLAALASLCHPVIALMMVIAGGFLVGGHALQTGMIAVRRAVPIVVLAVLLATFWFLPFGWYRSELDPQNYPLVGGWFSLMFSLPAWAEVILVGLAVVGGVRAVRLRHPMSMMLVATALTSALAVLVLPRGFIGGWETQQTLSWLAGRFLPFWHLTTVLLAGIGGGDLALRASARWAPATVVAPLAGLLLAVMAIGIVTGTLPLSNVGYVATPEGLVSHSKWLFFPQVETSLVPIWVSEGFGGYQDEPNWPEYHGLMTTMADVGAKHGCGRAMPEGDPSGMYGSFYQFTLLPYWTNGCIQSTTGIPQDLSINETFAELAVASVSYSNSHTVQPGVQYPRFDLSQGVSLMRELGIRYYMAFTTTSKAAADGDPDLTRVASSGPWEIYQINQVSMVEGLARQPVVVPSASGDALAWLDTASQWFLGSAEARPADGGPPNWSRVSDISTAPPGPPLPPVSVSHVSIDPSRISFQVDRIGVPVEVRASYFPWWQASGADGPWRLAPDDLVVVPTSHTVVLTAQPGVIDHFSVAVSIAAVFATAGLAVWDRRRRRSRAVAAPGAAGLRPPDVEPRDVAAPGRAP